MTKRLCVCVLDVSFGPGIDRVVRPPSRVLAGGDVLGTRTHWRPPRLFAYPVALRCEVFAVVILEGMSAPQGVHIDHQMHHLVEQRVSDLPPSITFGAPRRLEELVSKVDRDRNQ